METFLRLFPNLEDYFSYNDDALAFAIMASIKSNNEKRANFFINALHELSRKEFYFEKDLFSDEINKKYLISK